MKKTLSLLALATVLASLVWMPTHAQSQPFVLFVPPSQCTTTVSGNSTGTNGLTTSGASSTPVCQAQTSASGTNTHTYAYNIAPPSGISGTSTIWKITDVVFLYGVQTTALDTQVSVPASGTLNAALVFSYIQYPTAGASETPSTVTPVRADSGTLGLTPVTASINVATTTAGSFFSQTFTPATPITWNSDLKQILFKAALLCQATSATVTNSPGVFVHMTTY